MSIVIRLAGQDPMARVFIANLKDLEPQLLQLGAECKTPLDLFGQLVARGFPTLVTTKLLGDEFALVRLDKDQAIIRVPGPLFKQHPSWATADMARILGRGAWNPEVDDSLHQLHRLRAEVNRTVRSGDIRLALNAIITVAEQRRRDAKG